jgi:plastocyanin
LRDLEASGAAAHASAAAARGAEGGSVDMPSLCTDVDQRPQPSRSRIVQHVVSVWIFAAVLATCGALSPAVAGRIEGHVLLTPLGAQSLQQAALNPYAGSLGSICNGRTTTVVPGEDVRDVVVSVRDAGRSRPAATSAKPQLAQRGQSFEPRVLGVAVGTTVDFPNFDPIFHNVFSYSKTKRFDLGKYGQGKSAQVTFDKPGLVKVFCDIHSNMTGFVYVTETPWVAQPDDKGRFVLDGLPDGTYTLEMWHPERGTRTQSVTVTAAGTHLELVF